MTAPRSERPDMADYGVTDDPEGLLPWSWAEERLVGTRNFWLVTANAAGRPHAMPVWGVWMPDRGRWGAGFAASARKVRNMRANARVVVTTENSVECVSVEGQAIAVTGDEAEPLVAAWADKYFEETGQGHEETMAFMRESNMWEVIPDRAFGMIETPEQFSSAATRWVWK